MRSSLVPFHSGPAPSPWHVVSAHVVIDDTAGSADVLDRLTAYSSDDFDVEHSTFQLETDDRRRMELASHH